MTLAGHLIEAIQSRYW